MKYLLYRYFNVLKCYIKFINCSWNILSAQCIRRKNQSRKRFLKSITKYAPESIKVLGAKNKIRKVLNKRLSPEIYRYLQKKRKIILIMSLKKLKLSKLINKNISESDMVNIRWLNVFPIKN